MQRTLAGNIDFCDRLVQAAFYFDVSPLKLPSEKIVFCIKINYNSLIYFILSS